MLGADEKPDIKYSDVGGLDSQKQEIREAVELPMEQVSWVIHIICSKADDRWNFIPRLVSILLVVFCFMVHQVSRHSYAWRA